MIDYRISDYIVFQEASDDYGGDVSDEDEGDEDDEEKG